MPLIRVLQLIGSPTNAAYQELSELYARGSITALANPSRYNFIIAHVSPDGGWRFPNSLDANAIADAPGMTITEAISFVVAQQINIAIPQMFCRRGMTDCRALLEMLSLPYLGNRPLQMALTADKAKAKAIVAAAGVRVPRSELLQAGDAPNLIPWAVVKPNDADNSDGVTLVKTQAEYAAAIATAFNHSATVLVEDYIPLGREVRCGVVDRGGVLRCLPIEEYRVDNATRPVRRRDHKLGRDGSAQLTLVAKTAVEAWIIDVDDPITAAVHEAAKTAHLALGCRQYSLFDFRVDPDGQPWFLEAGLYCSFAPNSVLVTMMAAAGIPLDQFFAQSVADELGLTSNL